MLRSDAPCRTAAPQLAGVCALLLQEDAKLTASDIKAMLNRTAQDVTVGHANPACDPKGEPRYLTCGARTNIGTSAFRTPTFR